MVADFPEASEDGAHARFTPRFLVSVVVADMKPPPSRWNMPDQTKLGSTQKPAEPLPPAQKPKQQASAKPIAGKRIASGNWVASCVEQKGSSGPIVT